jgi:hypothetical protein
MEIYQLPLFLSIQVSSHLTLFIYRKNIAEYYKKMH